MTEKLTNETLDSLTQKCVEVSDTYANRCNIQRDADWFLLKLQEELGELSAEYLRGTGRGRMKGMSQSDVRVAMEDEAADVLAMLLLFAHDNNIDLQAALERKWFRYLPQSNEGSAT